MVDSASFRDSIINFHKAHGNEEAILMGRTCRILVAFLKVTGYNMGKFVRERV
jgi:hypothetical protein